MFEKLKDYILEKHVRSILRTYYLQFGLTLEEAERLPMKDLLVKLNEFLQNHKKEINYYTNVVSNLEDRVTQLSVLNHELREQLTHYKAENKALLIEKTKLVKDKYNLTLQNNLYKSKFGSKNLTKEQEKKAEFEVSKIKA